MKTLIPTFAFALLSSTAFGQGLFASAEFHSEGGDPDYARSVQRAASATAGPFSYSDSQTFAYYESAFGNALFQGATRTTSDYGRIGLYASASLQDYNNHVPQYARTSAGGGFIDPLAITGGSAGDSIYAEIRLRGTSESDTGALFYDSYYTNVEFYYLENGQYVSAGNQTFERRDNGVRGEIIDLTVGVTLTDYDPTRTYYFSGAANVTAEVFGGLDAAFQTVVDAENTAEITKIGFVGANGLSGRFVGGSGNVYPVPEPASFLALGAGLAFLRRAKRKG